MRIVAGEWRRRLLKAPSGEATRPTADRTRETLFNMLASRLGSFEGLAVADLFAGSGALGLEALSRGAANCLFVEQDPEAIRALRANVAALRAQDRCAVQAGSVLALGPARQACDLLLLDPPYHSGLAAPALTALAGMGWLTARAIAIVEIAAGETFSPPVGFTMIDERKYGAAKLVFLRREVAS